ncbi:NTP transferase domain-containing protein [Emticicia sp. BO119]|uniref:NTP transferase domain-containing protein n=1 Tax=Emticicia sp. BO119 TaxID=2757768 RepID=UPI0015EFE07A|nr:NTP transferase domain-containing protein [Emticicia sp. BO119]MBA4850219.1 NTP transferase domain-containing protein [Emticicia sp. BO119]
MNGLILIGGKSSRMGTDKSLLNYHGLSQREHLFSLLGKFCKEVYFSSRKEQGLSENVIIDTLAISPISGILSAFENNSKTAWLVLACDMPLVTDKAIELLLKHRNTEKMATAFYNPEITAPEPLITIYEPKAYPLLIEYINAGHKSPKVFLQNNNVQLIYIEEKGFLRNVNTKHEFNEYQSISMQ